MKMIDFAKGKFLLLAVAGFPLVGCASNAEPIVMKKGLGEITTADGTTISIPANICRQADSTWGHTVVGKCEVRFNKQNEQELVFTDKLIAVDGEVRGGVGTALGAVNTAANVTMAGAAVHAATRAFPSDTTNISNDSSSYSEGSNAWAEGGNAWASAKASANASAYAKNYGSQGGHNNNHGCKSGCRPH